MGREDNVEIFRDTEKICKENPKLKEVIKNSLKGQKLILEKENYNVLSKNIYNEDAKILVSKKRSFEAASTYSGYKVCVHNFASAANPGGGVVKGSSAQEECLCRCSSLYFCLNIQELWNKFYKPHRDAQNPLHNADIIYTPGVCVFKTDTSYPKLMEESKWYNVNVISCAAPDLREKTNRRYNSPDINRNIKDTELLEIHENRLRRILDVAVSEGNEVVILGAFGCGAFQNKPEIVAKAAKIVINDYKRAFKVIEFAVYCRPNDESNFRAFERVMKSR